MTVLESQEYARPTWAPKPFHHILVRVREPTQPEQSPANKTAPGIPPAAGLGVLGPKSVQRFPRPVGGVLRSQRKP